MHALKVDPGGGISADAAVRGSALDLGAIPLPELLHLVATLNGGLGGAGGAPGGDVVGNLLPVVGFEVAAAEGVPLLPIGVD